MAKESASLQTLVQVGASLSCVDLLTELSTRGYSRKDEAVVTTKSLCDDFLQQLDASSEDSFQVEVARKTSTDMLDHVEAEREVFVDWLTAQEGGNNKALLYVLKKSNSTEPKVRRWQILTVVNTLLSRRANPSARDSDGKTPLHFAAQKGFVDVVRELLCKEARPDVRDSEGRMPLHIAVAERHRHDEIAALLLFSMSHETVRALFTVPDDVVKSEVSEERAELSLHDLIRSGKMQQTVLAVLSCMMDPIGQSSSVRVHYHVLEADEHGRSPCHVHFDVNSKSCLHLMSKGHHMDLVYHDVVRLLLKRKWTEFARRSFQINAAIFIFFEFTLCFGAVLASSTEDPSHYTDCLQVVRGIMELLTSSAATYTFFLEAVQMIKHKQDYFRDKFNWLGLLSSMCLMAVVPLRFTHKPQQWTLYSIGFLLWTLRIFNFAAVSRTLGAYSQVLGRILLQDFPQFFKVFTILLLTFSGSFVLALRAENPLNRLQENSSFWHTLLTGIRILVEGQPALDHCQDGDAYRLFSTLLMTAFLGTCCVVLLNILIAQLSDTYQNVQSDAHRGLELNRAWIITRVELHSIYHDRFRKPHRISKYKAHEDIANPKDVLKKWDSLPLSEVNMYVKDIKDLHEGHSVRLRNISLRMKRQEVLLNKIVELLSAEPRAGSEVQVVTSGPDSQLSDLSSLSQGLQGDTDDDSVASSK